MQGPIRKQGTRGRTIFIDWSIIVIACCYKWATRYASKVSSSMILQTNNVKREVTNKVKKPWGEKQVVEKETKEKVSCNVSPCNNFGMSRLFGKTSPQHMQYLQLDDEELTLQM